MTHREQQRSTRSARISPAPKRRGKRRGTASVELALCLPIIMLLLLATMDASNMMYLKQSLTIAAYEGGRTALIPEADETNITADCLQVTTDRGVQNAQVAISPNNLKNLKVGDYIEVQVSAPCNDNTIVAQYFYAGKTITAKAEVMNEFE